MQCRGSPCLVWQILPQQGYTAEGLWVGLVSQLWDLFAILEFVQKCWLCCQLPCWPLDNVFNYTFVKLQYEEKCIRLSGQNYFAKSKTVDSTLDMRLLIQTVSVYLSRQTKAIVYSHLMYCSPSRNKLCELSFKYVFFLLIQTHFNHV